jgi:outer membrane protein OmpA-like peptidoglycan-associated protein
MNRKLVLFYTLLLATPMANADADCDKARAIFENATNTADNEQKAALYQEATELCPNFASYYELGRTQLKMDKLNEALINFKAALDKATIASPEEAQALGRLAQIHLKNNNLMQANIYIEKAYESNKENSPNWIKKLRQDIDLKNMDHVANATEINSAFIENQGSLSTRGSFSSRPKLQFNNITFETNSTELTAAGMRQAIELGKALSQQLSGKRHATLVGHTDKRGEDEHNQKLSERRAEAVKDLLESRHPELKNLLKTVGKGETELKYPGDTDEEHQLNRRVEVMIGS